MLVLPPACWWLVSQPPDTSCKTIFHSWLSMRMCAIWAVRVIEMTLCIRVGHALYGMSLRTRRWQAHPATAACITARRAPACRSRPGRGVLGRGAPSVRPHAPPLVPPLHLPYSQTLNLNLNQNERWTQCEAAVSEAGCPADWDPKQVTAAIVTCGGLCPGLNDVIQNIVFTLEDYGVRSDAVRRQRLL